MILTITGRWSFPAWASLKQSRISLLVFTFATGFWQATGSRSRHWQADAYSLCVSASDTPLPQWQLWKVNPEGWNRASIWYNPCLGRQAYPKGTTPQILRCLWGGGGWEFSKFIKVLISSFRPINHADVRQHERLVSMAFLYQKRAYLNASREEVHSPSEQFNCQSEPLWCAVQSYTCLLLVQQTASDKRCLWLHLSSYP